MSFAAYRAAFDPHHVARTWQDAPNASPVDLAHLPSRARAAGGRARPELAVRAAAAGGARRRSRRRPRRRSPTAPRSTDDGGLAGWQQILLFGSGGILLLGIAWLIVRDARSVAPTITTEEQVESRERREADIKRRKAKNRAAAKRSRAARKRNR